MTEATQHHQLLERKREMTRREGKERKDGGSNAATFFSFFVLKWYLSEESMDVEL